MDLPKKNYSLTEIIELGADVVMKIVEEHKLPFEVARDLTALIFANLIEVVKEKEDGEKVKEEEPKKSETKKDNLPKDIADDDDIPDEVKDIIRKTIDSGADVTVVKAKRNKPISKK